MYIQHLNFKNFRCFEIQEFNLDPTLNFFYGHNGAGKTSILESIFFLTQGKGFHHSKPSELRRWKSDELYVTANIKSEDQDFWMGLAWHNQWQAKIRGTKVKSISSLLIELPLITFTSLSVELISGNSQFRRQFIDYLMFHVEPQFRLAYRKYRHVLSQRNAALKMNMSIEPWNSQLAHYGQIIHEYRNNIIDELFDILANELSMQYWDGGQVNVNYMQGWPKEQSLEECLKKSEQTDRKRCFTQYGPHRADFKIFFRGMKAKQFVSRGEQKWISAALVLSAGLLLDNNLETKPVILLDDPFSELDSQRAESLFKVCIDTGSQLLVTGVDQPDWLKSYGKMFHVEHGSVVA